VCANVAAAQLFDVDFPELPVGVERNLVTLVTQPQVRQGAANWIGMVRAVFPGEFEPLIEGTALSKDADYFAAVVEHVRSRETGAGRGDAALRALFSA